MTEKGTSGIEKLRSFADDAAEFIRDVADQIELRHQLDVDAAVEETEDELADRLMPEGLEWPRFEDGKPIARGDAPDGIAAVMIMLDGSGYELIDMPDYAVRPRGERVKRPVTEVIGADGLPIKVGDTVYLVSGSEPYRVESLPQRKNGMIRLYGLESKREKLYLYYPDVLTHTPPDTQERIDEDALMDAGKYAAGHPETARLREYPTSFSAKQAMMADLLRRQRILDGVEK